MDRCLKEPRARLPGPAASPLLVVGPSSQIQMSEVTSPPG